MKILKWLYLMTWIIGIFILIFTSIPTYLKNENFTTRSKPINLNLSSYLWLYGDSNDYNDSDYGVKINTERNKDLNFKLTYQINSSDYDFYNNINPDVDYNFDDFTFFMVPKNEVEISPSDNETIMGITASTSDMFQIPIDKSKVLMDGNEHIVDFNIDHSYFDDIVDDFNDDYLLIPQWGTNDERSGDLISFLSGNFTHEPGNPYEPIWIHFNKPDIFYEPDIYLTGENEMHLFFQDSSNIIGFNYNLPPKTYATKVDLIIENAANNQIIETINITNNISNPVDGDHSSAIYWWDTNNLNLDRNINTIYTYFEIDWIYDGVEGYHEGTTSTLDSNTGTFKYYTIYYEGIDTSIDVQPFDVDDEQIQLNINYESTNKYDFRFRDNIDLIFKRNSDGLEQQLTIFNTDTPEGVEIPHKGNVNITRSIKDDFTSDFFINKELYSVAIEANGLLWSTSSAADINEKHFLSDWTTFIVGDYIPVRPIPPIEIDPITPEKPIDTNNFPIEYVYYGILGLALIIILIIIVVLIKKRNK